MEKKLSKEQLERLMDALASCRHDPLRFVQMMFPWGVAGTELETAKIEEWQVRLLIRVRDKLATPGEAIQEAVASGHGIGKSAMVSWLILWAISTASNTRGVVTANTDSQLQTKTWPELGKWYSLFVGKMLFEYNATSICTASKDEEKRKRWRIDAIPWSKSTPESFAGLHNKGRRVVMIFDEASAIPDIIWEIGDAALTDADTELLWFAFGNPTRNRGRFHKAFHDKQEMKIWGREQVDSRRVGITNKIKLQRWEDTYGEDSDFFRVRARGVFPKIGDHQFISRDAIDAARGRQIHPTAYNFAPKILTLDSAWDGGDEIVCGLRQGLAYRQLWVQAKNDDDMALAQRLAKSENHEQADAVFIDQAYGTGVYSIGKNLNRKWVLIAFGSKPGDPAYLNKRAEMYGLGRDWLYAGGCIPDDEMLVEELAAQEKIDREDAKVQLLAKEELKEPDHLGRSPGRSDAWALSFALPVENKKGRRLQVDTEPEYVSAPKPYNLFGDLEGGSSSSNDDVREAGKY